MHESRHNSLCHTTVAKPHLQASFSYHLRCCLAASCDSGTSELGGKTEQWSLQIQNAGIVKLCSTLYFIFDDRLNPLLLCQQWPSAQADRQASKHACNRQARRQATKPLFHGLNTLCLAPPSRSHHPDSQPISH